MTSTIITKNSSTATSVPSSGSLTQGELAVNVTDKRLFTKDSGGTVVEVGTNPSTLVLPSGSANGVTYLNGSKVLTSGSALTFDGTTFRNTGGGAAFSGVVGAGISASVNGRLRAFNSTNDRFIEIYNDSTTSIINSTYGSAGATPLVFQITDSEQMRLTSTGLGIGTSSPGYKIDVNGYGRFSSGVLGSGGLTMYGDASSGSGMLLTTSGNLGLGVTPSAWSTGYKAFQVNTTASISATSSAMRLSNNGYVNTGGTDTYLTTAAATTYIQGSGQHAWYNAPSGTAGNAISFTQAMTLDASGNLMVGTTTALTKLTVSGGYVSATDGTIKVYMGPDGSGGLLGTTSNHYLRFITNDTERARIDSSGNLLIGRTSQFGSERVSIESASTNTLLTTYNFSATSVTHHEIRNQNGVVGSIVASGGSTSYNTSSDQRLKENIANADSASALVDSLQVRKFDWKADGSHQRYGFIAQELVTVVPEAVYQPEDTEQMMAVDYSKLVPMLVKEVQSLRKRLADAGL